MSVKAILVRGHDAQMVDYTPATAVEGGDVTIDNGVPVVSHRPYDPDDVNAEANPQVAIHGGIYDLDKDGTSGPVFAFGDPVYVHATNGATTSDANAHFGMCVADAGTNDATVRVFHNPNIGTASS
jgi:predicted RecA/RadA family phage recombinase